MSVKYWVTPVDRARQIYSFRGTDKDSTLQWTLERDGACHCFFQKTRKECRHHQMLEDFLARKEVPVPMVQARSTTRLFLRSFSGDPDILDDPEVYKWVKKGNGISKVCIGVIYKGPGPTSIISGFCRGLLMEVTIAFEEETRERAPCLIVDHHSEDWGTIESVTKINFRKNLRI